MKEQHEQILDMLGDGVELEEIQRHTGLSKPQLWDTLKHLSRPEHLLAANKVQLLGTLRNLSTALCQLSGKLDELTKPRDYQAWAGAIKSIQMAIQSLLVIARENQGLLDPPMLERAEPQSMGDEEFDAT